MQLLRWRQERSQNRHASKYVSALSSGLLLICAHKGRTGLGPAPSTFLRIGTSWASYVSTGANHHGVMTHFMADNMQKIKVKVV